LAQSGQSRADAECLLSGVKRTSVPILRSPFLTQSIVHELSGANARRVENGNNETSSSDLGTLLRRVAEASTHEVEVLIDDLYGLRKKLHSDGDRIQSDIERHGELSQGVMQPAAIISDSVKKIPGAPSKFQRVRAGCCQT
jgi:hypothetical protein